MKQTSLWYINAVFYEVYVRAYYDANGDGHGDLRGLIEKLDYLQRLGVDCIWLLPVYGSPLVDDGYDIADYYLIHPDYGTLDDFKELVAAAHQRGLRVIADLVLNHTSDQHSWFQAARTDRNSPYRDYYVWSDDDQKYADTRIIFVDTEKSNWTWDEQAGQFFFHRFYGSQPDLNYDNPAVQEAMLEVMRFWLDSGVDGFRADAVPYLFEREGTNCENLPETHAYLKRLRKYLDEHYPDKVLLCEANQWPEDVRPYFGDGDEFHMGFHFPLMPRIYMALQQGSTEPLAWVIERTPHIPANCQWCTFLRNHDELTLEMVTEEERQWMWQEYAPEPRMRLNLGIRRRLAPLLNNDRRKIELAYSLLFTMPGSPIIYYGDEIGMGDNIWLPDRNGVRTPMQWKNGRNGGFSEVSPERLYAPAIESAEFGYERVNVSDQEKDPASLLKLVQRMIQIRKTHLAFGNGEFSWATQSSGTEKAVAAYWRTYGSERLLIIQNLSGFTQDVHLELHEPSHTLSDLMTESQISLLDGNKLALTLGPYEYRWLIS